MNNIEHPLLVLVGPTAIGKTALSLQIAERYDCEIISVDSMQVYRFMDIGTAKVGLEDRQRIPHHLIDIVNPDEDYDAARFAEQSISCIRDIHKRNKIPLLTGGTGLYLRALFEGIFPEAPSDPDLREELKQRLEREGCSKLHEELLSCDRISAEKIHQNDSQRLLRALEVYHLTGTPLSKHIIKQKAAMAGPIFTNICKIGLTCDRDILYQRINLRCKLMLDSGLEEEVRGLLKMGYSDSLKSMQSIGYRHMQNYIHGVWSREEMERLLARDTRRYAKRQYTWFSKSDDLLWQQVTESGKILNIISKWLS